jgi:hypothetical protein
MALDDQLITRSNQGNKEADNSGSNALDSGYEENSADRAGSLRAEMQAAKNGLAPESLGDLRADKRAAGRQQDKKSLSEKAVEGALSPAKQAISELLKSAWENLIPSWGLTLIWIDIHVFFNIVLGEKLFCNLGEEWLPTKSGMPGIKK